MKNKLTFETAMTRLDEITALLSGDAITLNESLSLFKEASELVESCEAMLKGAALEVKEFGARAGDTDE